MMYGDIVVYVEIPVRVRVNYYCPATPDVYYLSNGDPGYPGDPEELDYELASDDAEIRNMIKYELEADNIYSTVLEAIEEQEFRRYEE
jgi:hypothetical protein